MVRGDGVLMMLGWVAISSWGHLNFIYFLTVTLDSSNTFNDQLGFGLAYMPTCGALHYLRR